MKSEHYCNVEKFMKLAGQEMPDTPKIPSLEVRELRAKLIFEECLETITALGFAVFTLNERVDGKTVYKPTFFENEKPNLTKIADGCADISVVTIGTLIACGIHDKELLECVDENNLAKFGEGHSIREDGKLIKPPNHQPPDIAKILRDQIYSEEENGRFDS